MLKRISLAILIATFACTAITGCEESKKETAAKTDTPAPKPNPTPEPTPTPEPAQTTNVIISTSMGDITVELNASKAPMTVANFLNYVNDSFYDGTIFHRVMKGFMIQAGGFTPNMIQKTQMAPIKNEASNGLKNDRGTIAMGQLPGRPDSATTHFFINHVNNSFLNPRPGSAGYAVFGKVTAGMDVVDKIAVVPTTTKAGSADVPINVVTINSIKLAK